LSYYTERHGLRKPIERTYTISLEIYYMLFNCCEKYYNNIAWKYPQECSDGFGCCGVDYIKLNTILKFEIPNLYRDRNGNISAPRITRNIFEGDNEPEYDQYALLDYIEFIARNVKDVSNGDFHSYFGHYHLKFHETQDAFDKFREEINSIFEVTGMLFTLTGEKVIERVVENSPLSEEILIDSEQISESGTRELVKNAIALYKMPNPAARQDSVEKIWDALERLKTYYTDLDKKGSATKVVNDMSNGQAEYITVFDAEFRALTEIGNSFRIRHHETNKIDITDNRHHDYFFNRCLSLIALAIQYLQ